jgi:hypothetical protein
MKDFTAAQAPEGAARANETPADDGSRRKSQVSDDLH